MRVLFLGLLSLCVHSIASAEEHDHHFVADIQSFHDVLSPLWHADVSSKRQADTCAAIPQMRAAAQKMTYAAAPDLVESLNNLQKFCRADPKTFNASFHLVHEAFHRVEKQSQ